MIPHIPTHTQKLSSRILAISNCFKHFGAKMCSFTIGQPVNGMN